MTRKSDSTPMQLHDLATYPDGRPLPRNTRTVPCPLPGYEGVEVSFIVSRSRVEIEAAGDDQINQIASSVAGFPGWPFKVAPPTPGDPASFQTVGADLLNWCFTAGMRSAMVLALSPNL